MNKFKLFSKKLIHTGFTLAEVLITLGIIGVVSAMTIPTLMNKTNNSEYTAGLKKVISEITSATLLMKTENGGTIQGVYSTSDEALDAICGHLKCTKKCSSASDRKQCFHSTNWYSLDGRNGWGDYSSGAVSSAGILADGTAFSFGWYKDCDLTAVTTNNACAIFTFDINGFKKPNKMGRDFFELYILPDKILPNGALGTVLYYPDNTNYCTPDSKAEIYNGAACAGRIMIENGMNY